MRMSQNSSKRFDFHRVGEFADRETENEERAD